MKNPKKKVVKDLNEEVKPNSKKVEAAEKENKVEKVNLVVAKKENVDSNKKENNKPKPSPKNQSKKAEPVEKQIIEIKQTEPAKIVKEIEKVIPISKTELDIPYDSPNFKQPLNNSSAPIYKPKKIYNNDKNLKAQAASKEYYNKGLIETKPISKNKFQVKRVNNNPAQKDFDKKEFVKKEFVKKEFVKKEYPKKEFIKDEETIAKNNLKANLNNPNNKKFYNPELAKNLKQGKIPDKLPEIEKELAKINSEVINKNQPIKHHTENSKNIQINEQNNKNQDKKEFNQNKKSFQQSKYIDSREKEILETQPKIIEQTKYVEQIPEVKEPVSLVSVKNIENNVQSPVVVTVNKLQKQSNEKPSNKHYQIKEKIEIGEPVEKNISDEIIKKDEIKVIDVNEPKKDIVNSDNLNDKVNQTKPITENKTDAAPVINQQSKNINQNPVKQNPQNQGQNSNQNNSNKNQNRPVQQSQNQPVKQNVNQYNKPNPSHNQSQNQNRNEDPKVIFTQQNLNKSKLVDSESRKSDYFQKFYNNLESFLKNKLLVESQVKIIVGVSGGVDSISLIDALANIASNFGINLEIAHFNHNLRGSYSKRDEEFVKSIAESYGIPCHVSSANVKEQAKKMSQSIETAARTLRYKFFEKVVLSTKAQFLATAHSADDSAETFFLNLLRGTGLTGLSGIPARRHFHKNTFVIRPFLFLKKSDIIVYAEKRKLEWKEDESNQETKYTRNKIRLDLIPKLVEEYSPAIIDLITRTAQNISSADRFITETIKSYIEQVIIERNSSLISFNLPLLFTHSNFIRGEILQTCITNNFKIQPLSLSTIDRIFELDTKQSGAVCEIDSAIFATKDRDRLIISRKEEKFFINKSIDNLGEFVFGKYKLILSRVEKKDVKLGANANIEYFDMEFLPQVLQVRNWKIGDSFTPLNLKGTIKVSDFLINQKIANIDKDKIFVLTDKVNIMWIIGKRICDEYKITKDTKEYLRAEWVVGEGV